MHYHGLPSACYGHATSAAGDARQFSMAPWGCPVQRFNGTADLRRGDCVKATPLDQPMAVLQSAPHVGWFICGSTRMRRWFVTVEDGHAVCVWQSGCSKVVWLGFPLDRNLLCSLCCWRVASPRTIIKHASSFSTAIIAYQLFLLAVTIINQYQHFATLSHHHYPSLTMIGHH